MTDQERIVQLVREIADLRARLPKHSIPMTLLVQLEDLEDELAKLQSRTSRGAA